MGGPEEGAWKAFGILLYLPQFLLLSLIFTGYYIRRQMSMGRAITIPHFGIFTFSAPDVVLKGVTNPNDRDK